VNFVKLAQNAAWTRVFSGPTEEIV